MSSSRATDGRYKSDTSDDEDDYGYWRNIFSIVRKWDVSFKGDSEESINLFLVAVKDMQELTDLSDSELLEALPCLLKGMALMWYRLISKKWSSCEHFCEDARHVFRNSEEYNQKLLMKAYARKQSKDEAVVDYIHDLRNLMKRQEPEPAVDTQIKLLYSNMIPALQRIIRRNEVKDIAEFYSCDRKAERVVEEQRDYKSPPAPEGSLVPELAYKPPAEGVRTVKLTPEVEAIISKLIDEKIGEIGITAETSDRRLVSGDDRSDLKGTRRPKKNNLRCFACGEHGHFARDCTR